MGVSKSVGVVLLASIVAVLAVGRIHAQNPAPAQAHPRPRSPRTSIPTPGTASLCRTPSTKAGGWLSGSINPVSVIGIPNS